MRCIECLNIYQRKLDEKRIPQLEEYMSYSRATFPNGIILNARCKIEFKNNTLTFEDREDAFFIIDGQHRIAALKKYNGQASFDVCVIIFNNISVDDQTEIFVTVNSEQKRVNPSVRFNLHGNDAVDTPERVVKNIAQLLNEVEKILLSDEPVKRDESKISLAAFMKPVLHSLYDEKEKYIIKDRLLLNNNMRSVIGDIKMPSSKYFWKYYVNCKDEYIYLINHLPRQYLFMPIIEQCR